MATDDPKVAAAWAQVRRFADPAERRFGQCLGHAEQVQTEVLLKLLQANRTTETGVANGFGAITGYADFARCVPIVSYEAIQRAIDRTVQGERNVLVGEDIAFVETTSGSSGAAKIVLYTRTALAGFENALLAWIADLARRRPGVAAGRVYFALSPAGRSDGEKVGVLPLGSPDGFAYFGPAGAALETLSVAPIALTRLSDLAHWQFLTSVCLLAAADLSFIWVWSPTYLLELLRAMRRDLKRIVAAIAGGTSHAFGGKGPGLKIAADPERARLIAAAFATDGIDARRLWPALDTISCWMDAASAPFAAELQALFPGVHFQPKGLMSTEAAVSIPFGDEAGSVLALESGFFEFVAADGRVLPAWQVEPGRSYRVVVSNGSGLYRYDTGDLVEIVGRTGTTPRLRFLGRDGLVSDLCGEKLSEAFVLGCLRSSSPGGPYPATLMPVPLPKPHYMLFVEANGTDAGFAAAVEEALRDNPHYAYARRLGQLGALDIRPVRSLFARFQRFALHRGRSLSGLKAPALLKEHWPGLAEFLAQEERLPPPV